MNQEGPSPANKRRKIEDAIAHDSCVQNVDDNTVDKSTSSTVVNLTDDAWLLVFDNLGAVDRKRIARVCKRWKYLAQISWRSISRLSFEGFYYVRGRWLTDDILKVCLQQCGTRLRCLDVSQDSFPYHSLTSRALDLVGLYAGTSLQELSLSDIDFTNTALKTTTEKYPRLTSLSLIGCKYIGEVEELMSTFKMLQSLKSLDVSFSEWINDESFSQAPQSLETINITACCRLTGQSITNLLQNCPKLKRFKFRNLAMDPRSNFLTSHLLQTLSRNLPLLEELDVNYQTDAVTDHVFSELGRHCPLLRFISCDACAKLTDAAIYNLSPCRHLETIDLSRCRQVTDQGLIQLSSAHSQLKVVNLLSCGDHITDIGVSRLLSEHPNLLELKIAYCKRVTDGVLPALVSSLQRRQDTQPLSIWVYRTSISRKKVNAYGLRENTRCIILCIAESV